MKRVSRYFGLTFSVLLAAAAFPAASQAAPLAPITWSSMLNLGAVGGEPSIQDDGHGNVYITTPTSGPAALQLRYRRPVLALG